MRSRGGRSTPETTRPSSKDGNATIGIPETRVVEGDVGQRSVRSSGLVTTETNAKRFGTFSGVFTPSILTILGVVMYLRLGWVTGEAGLGFALAIVVVSHLISLATGLSVASIATNRTVGAGGAYFMISRALGAPAGASIGIPLFFAQSLSVTFYIVGFAESVRTGALAVIGDPSEGGLPALVYTATHPAIIGTVTNVGLTAISIKSADLALKTQYVVMAAIVASLVVFFVGTSGEYPTTIEWSNPERSQSLAEIFAIFFPAVTGIMAGVSMSGDLKDPRKSIPQGTLAAIAVGFVVYMAFPVWLSVNYSNEELTTNNEAVFDLAIVPALIYVGVWGATLSSALGSILTAPRTLQALAKDGLAPRPFARGYGKGQEPVAGLILTFALSQAGIFLGSLDLIAPVLTMFFLATYGVTNLACGLQKWAASPSFRPRFRVAAPISLGGGLACFYVMSIIDLPAMVVSLLSVRRDLFGRAERRALGTTYGDARHGIWAALGPQRAAAFATRRVPSAELATQPRRIRRQSEEAHLLAAARQRHRAGPGNHHVLPPSQRARSGSSPTLEKTFSDRTNRKWQSGFPTYFIGSTSPETSIGAHAKSPRAMG